MKQKVLSLCFVVGFVSSCYASTKDHFLWGVWIPVKKETTFQYMNANTSIGLFKGTYNSIYILPDKIDNEGYGIIHDLGNDLRITYLDEKYPIWILKVKHSIRVGTDKRGNEIRKWITGEIIVHFVNENEIWFENNLSPELSNIIKKRANWILFGQENTYWRAERLTKPIIPAAP